MATVTLADVSVFAGGQHVLDRINLEVPDGAFAAVVGPSGTGKTTLLRAVAGLSPVDSGRIRFDDLDITDVAPAQRDVGMVFQTAALLPHRSVRRNLEFPLEIRHETADAIRDRVGAEVRAMHIEHLLRRRPDQLSRGEEQLVQIARTMVRVPRLLLLDEPFAPLDANLRSKMRAEIRVLQRGYGVTTILATNDPADAMVLADRMIVVDGTPAVVVQHGTPRELHDEPATLSVASATGPIGALPATVEAGDSGFWLTSSGALRLRSWAPALDGYVGRTVTLGVRPSDLVRDARGEGMAMLERIIPGGDRALLCRWGGRMITATGSAEPREVGTEIRLRVGRQLIFDADSGRRIA